MNTNHYWSDIITNSVTKNKSTLVGYWLGIAAYYLDSITGVVCHKMNWTGKIASGEYKNAYYWIFIS
jgi:hypothetical protein